eukprot:CFRG0505T1
MGNVKHVIMQYFHWYTSNNGELWNTVNHEAQHLADIGITRVWLPPSYKGINGNDDVGYGVYDMYDMGEFYQKDSVRTKYGTKDQYIDAIYALRYVGIETLADIVFNHRIGGDETENIHAIPRSHNNRLRRTGEAKEISAYTNFYFPGRNGVYSSFEWHWYHFNAADYNHREPDDSSIFLFDGKQFSHLVNKNYGNYDFLLGCDIDFKNEEVLNELSNWGKWMLDTTGVDGFRLDAIKHIPSWHYPKWIKEMEEYSGKELFAMGEYWEYDRDTLTEYIEATKGTMSLFDVPLHFEFSKASVAGESYDMRTIYDHSLVKTHPTLAVTFVANHDSQAIQELESVVESWFKPIAYALTLLRQDGQPSIFHPDYYGAEYTGTGKDGNEQHVIMPSHSFVIEKYLYARTNFAYGEQRDYFDHVNIIGWTFLGDETHPGSMAVLLSNGDAGAKNMEVGKPNTQFVDITGYITDPVVTDENGWAAFRCNEASVSVWIEADKQNI